ncbi:putative secreted protein (Por secretion system target) [Lutibacter oceani]|uniref:Putative secreted protein (Por secretion system target) n=1 Tax=Lutibacter oceani TaxID=1853311 RepID=A0A3D9RUS4_9FLAO|nr:endonuclease [Lutibacter oceani]REE83238.1 putative secreted protein (Por secretion system target) [Lutibacter oceani]
MKKITFLVMLIPFWIQAQIPSYYNDVNLNLSGTNLKDELASKIISTHTNFLSYSQVWDASKITDLDPSDATNSNVILIYGYNDTDGNYITDRTRSKDANGGTAGTDWNREHTYAKSLGVPNLGTSGPGSDAHHLRPSDVTFNGQRSSKKFASGIGNAGDSNGGWYPGDEWKGDIARMMMYMYLRYGNQCLPTGVGIGSASATPDDMIDLFLQWNAEDPVSQIEKNRNQYHGNSTNAFAQGNRNPFIDNPAFATQIWNGPQAEDLFGNSVPDTEAPTAPSNVIASNITNSTLDLNWTASTDNIAVSSYDIYKDGIFLASSTTNSYSVIDLTLNTTYDFTVFAKDATGNTSGISNTETITTTNIIDTEAPTSITDLIASNTTSSTTSLSWAASTDNIAVTSYEISKDGVFLASSTTNSYLVTGLMPTTSYTFSVIAKDAAGNNSTISNTATTTTLDVVSGNDIFISEYVEGSSNNKAIEIANFTGNTVDLSAYSLKRNTNGGSSWGAALVLSGQLINEAVFVAANSSSTSVILNVADLTSSSDALLFNGNDPVGLFKNNVLIDIVGTFNNGTANFAADTTLRRKTSITNPSTTYNVNDWDSFSTDTFDDLGSHAASGGGTADTEAPTAPAGLTASNISETALDLSWTASTDNIGVTNYEVYKDGTLFSTVVNTSINITGLSAATTYSFSVTANDAAGNTSTNSNTVNTSTIDITSPSTPLNFINTNTTQTSTYLSWDISTDNVGVSDYAIFIDGILLTTTTNNFYNVINLIPETTYAFTIMANDASGNSSTLSNAINVTTLSSGGSGSGNELFISEYIEGSSNNKAIEIANFTGNTVDLSTYSLKRNTNGGSSWGAAFNLTGQILDGDVFVVANSSATSTILNIADLTSSSDALLFNGNDPVGLFKNDVLIDIVGTFNNGSANFAADTTLRRIATITNPSTTYNTNEWISFSTDTFDDLGSHTVSGGGNGISDILFAHSFETDWDGWIDGGSDCYRINSQYSFDGNYSIRIRDNSGIQSAMTSSSYDVSAYENLEVKFDFYSDSMESNEDFWLQYFDGSTWQTVKAFVSGTDFNNSEFTESIVTISAATYNFPANAQFRFQCDASSNSDAIYIDNVIVTATSGIAAKRAIKPFIQKKVKTYSSNLPEIEEMNFYPNPSSIATKIVAEIDIEDDIVNVEVLIANVQGRIIKTINIDNLKNEYFEQNMDISNLKSGIYFVKITSNKGLNITKKLIVQ